jgi:hypothetical protein
MRHAAHEPGRIDDMLDEVSSRICMQCSVEIGRRRWGARTGAAVPCDAGAQSGRIPRNYNLGGSRSQARDRPGDADDPSDWQDAFRCKL